MGIQVARQHHPQVVGHELDHVVVVANRRVFLEQRRGLRVLHIAFDGHQPILARFLEDVELQRQQVHVARFGVLAAFEGLAYAAQRFAQHLGLVADGERTQGAAADDQDLDRQGLEDDPDIAARDQVSAKDAEEREPVTQDHPHVCSQLGYETISDYRHHRLRLEPQRKRPS